MKEVTIKYKDSKTLELLKSLATFFDFSISESKEASSTSKKKVLFIVLHVDTNTKGYKFNRDEANEHSIVNLSIHGRILKMY
jgi:hypothetical protein